MDDHTHHEIKEVNDYSTFYNVYKTYTYPPYNEDWTDSEIEQEYHNINQRGFLYGYFIDGKCIGILALRIKDQPLEFDNNTKSIYLSDLTVVYKYNKSDTALRLIEFAINYAKENEYSLIYLRTLKDNYSNEYKVFKKVGFTKMPDVIEVVKRKRTRLMKEEDCRFFWQLKLN